MLRNQSECLMVLKVDLRVWAEKMTTEVVSDFTSLPRREK